MTCHQLLPSVKSHLLALQHEIQDLNLVTDCLEASRRLVSWCTGIASQIKASFQYDARTTEHAFHTTTLPCPEFTTHKVTAV